VTNTCGHFSRRRLRACGALAAGLIASSTTSPAQRAATDAEGSRWAVIIVGIPGDADHEPLFRQTADAWQDWLTTSQQVPADHVVRLPTPPATGEAPHGITADAIRDALADLKQKLQPADALWVLTLGHGNYDGKHAWLHVQGRDPSEQDFGLWFRDIPCREQVFWLTQSNSGWFVRPLSEPGRVVIAATAADDESNETEFPHALATVFQGPPDKADANGDGHVSLLELYSAVITETKRRFDSDRRLPTEHAQLDDNGDGLGTELRPPGQDAAGESTVPPAPGAKIDGDLANTLRVPWKRPMSAE
jgi:hypothetical protein